MDAAAFRVMARRCRDLLQIAVLEEIKVQLHQWAEEFEAEADSLNITDRDDAEIVAFVAEGFLRRLGREAPAASPHRGDEGRASRRHPLCRSMAQHRQHRRAAFTLKLSRSL